MELTQTCCFEFDRKRRPGGKRLFLRTFCFYFRVARFTHRSPLPEVDKSSDTLSCAFSELKQKPRKRSKNKKASPSKKKKSDNRDSNVTEVQQKYSNNSSVQDSGKIRFTGRRGNFYMLPESVDIKPPLFVDLGNGLWINRPAPDKDSLRIALWRLNKIGKKERIDTQRYQVDLDMNQLDILRSPDNIDHMERALNSCEDKRFTGYVLHLGNKWFVTVKPAYCELHFRQWWCKEEDEGNTRKPLNPSKRGFYCNHTQFVKLKEFLQIPLLEEIPAMAEHRSPCLDPNHDKTSCDLCTQRMLLPLEMEYLETMA